ncbi:MAG: hypothetical protein KC594_17850 [Nitrospira sp.]|nr:hypothetical protein [Nitrospira sp.]
MTRSIPLNGEKVKEMKKLLKGGLMGLMFGLLDSAMALRRMQIHQLQNNGDWIMCGSSFKS